MHVYSCLLFACIPKSGLQEALCCLLDQNISQVSWRAPSATHFQKALCHISRHCPPCGAGSEVTAQAGSWPMSFTTTVALDEATPASYAWIIWSSGGEQAGQTQCPFTQRKTYRAPQYRSAYRLACRLTGRDHPPFPPDQSISLPCKHDSVATFANFPFFMSADLRLKSQRIIVIVICCRALSVGINMNEPSHVMLCTPEEDGNLHPPFAPLPFPDQSIPNMFTVQDGMTGGTTSTVQWNLCQVKFGVEHHSDF